VPPELDETFAALADPTRRAMIGLLREQPLRPSAIARALSMSRPATSQHLGVLRKAGLVTETISEQDARVRVYQLRPEPFSDLRAWLDEVEAFWGEQLAGFKAYAERRKP
jgi:DNA-binding transcriptional ArsR family regulator